MESFSHHVIGVEVDGEAVRAASLRWEKGKVVCDWTKEIPAKPLYTALQEIIDNVEDEMVITAVDAVDVLVRQLPLDVPKARNIPEVIDFQIEPLLPFPIEESVLDYVVLGKEEKRVDVAVMTVRKERLGHHLEQMGLGGVEPERVASPQMALALFLHHCLPLEEPQGIIHLGETATTFAIVKEGKVMASRSLSMGASHLRGEKELDFLNFDPDDFPGLATKIERFRSEVAKTIFAMTREMEIAQIFPCGLFKECLNLDRHLALVIEVPMSELPASSIEGVDHARFAVPIGLALSGLPGKVPVVDFRRNEFAYPKPWRRLRKQLVAYFGLCLGLSVALFFAGKAMHGHQMRAITYEYRSLSDLAHDALGIKVPQSTGNAQQVLASARALSEKLRKAPETYALVPDVPRVSDFLAWLATHPQVVVEGKSVIQVEDLHYAMVKYPNVKRQSEPYRVKVELVFTAESPTAAREFHDALIEPNLFLDPKEEVKWSLNRDHYKTSFYLKDKTHYPTGRKKR